MTKNPDAVALGRHAANLARLGAKNRSVKQRKQSALNGRQGGRPATRPLCRECRLAAGLEPWNMQAPADFTCRGCKRRRRDL